MQGESEAELKADGARYRVHVVGRKGPDLPLQPMFAGGGDLVRHCLAPLGVERNEHFSGIQAGDLA